MDNVGALISGRLLAIEPMASVAEAAAMLAREHVSHLVVVKGGELLGVLCSCDIERSAQGAAVGQAMSRAVFTIDAEAQPAEALASMHAHNVSCLPVLAHGALRGVVTLRDLVRLGVADDAERCSACGSTEHVRCEAHGVRAALCLECMRRSEPPAWDDEVGGGD